MNMSFAMNICQQALPAKHHLIQFRPVKLEPDEIVLPRPPRPPMPPRNMRVNYYDDLKRIVADMTGDITSKDFENHPMKRASAYLIRMEKRGLVVRQQRQIYGVGKPLKVYRAVA